MTIRKLFIRFNEHIKSANWKQKTAVGKHIFDTNHEVNISELKLVQPIRHRHENLLNVDDGNIKSPLLNLFVVKRKVDERVIDLTEDTPNTSMNETFYDCE